MLVFPLMFNIDHVSTIKQVAIKLMLTYISKQYLVVVLLDTGIRYYFILLKVPDMLTSNL